MPSFYDNRAIRSDGHAAASDAAQFMPFAALRGLDALLDSKSENLLKVPKHELTDEEAQELSLCVSALRHGNVVRCEFYKNGIYQQVVGTVDRLSLSERWICLDGHRIAFEDLKALKAL